MEPTYAPAATADVTIRLGAFEPGDVRVIGLNGREGLNELFCYDVQLCASRVAVDLDSILKAPCTIEIDAGGGTRTIHGIVAAFEQIGERGHYTYYAARVVPRHWLLTKRYGSRIFQETNCPDMTVAGIVRKVLRDAGVPEDMLRFVLTRDLPVREYVVQYRETEYDFVARLLEDEGLAFYFEHGDGRHVLVIGDAPAVFVNNPLYDGVPYCDPNGMDTASEHVFAIRERRSVEFGAIGLTDFNFKRPALDLRTRAPGGALPPNRYSTLPPPPPAPPNRKYAPPNPPAYGAGDGSSGDGGSAGAVYGSGGPPAAYGGASSGEAGHSGGADAGGGYGTSTGGAGAAGGIWNRAGGELPWNRDGRECERGEKEHTPYAGSMPGGCYPSNHNGYRKPPRPPHVPAPPPDAPPAAGPWMPAPPVDYGSAEVRVDYPGGYFERSAGQRRAQIQLEEHQSQVRVFEMRANVRGLAAGYRFQLEYHPLEALNGEYLVTELALRVEQSQSLEEDADCDGGFRFSAHVRAIRAEVAYRPPCRTPRPFVHGAQTALVVGPARDEIYTDAYGRVKVQFHWDPEGVYDERSSCWIRVSQGLAGGQYGMMFLPRVGQEVIVDFLEGDPDRPIITGRVYNGDCMPPYKLPDHKTRSCIRTSSTPGGYGANEIRFEDKKYEEHLLVYAERDLHLRSKASRFETVGGECHAQVYKDCFEKFHENVSREVCLDLAEKCGGNQSLTVMGQLREAIYGKHSESCSDYSLKARNGEVVIEAATGITLKVGGNFIKIDAAGVHVMGTIINLNSGGMAGIGYWPPVEKPRKPKPALGTEYGHDVQYHATANAPADGGYAGMSDRAERPEEPDRPTSWVEIELVDEAGQPWPNEPYEIVAPDGSVIRGTLDANGQAHVSVDTDGACEIRFPKLDMAAWERC